MQNLFDVKLLLEMQLDEVDEWHLNSRVQGTGGLFLQRVSDQHYTNFKLWHQEDDARDPDVSDARIAEVKRTIDKLNQKRNDQIELLDEWILQKLQKVVLESEINATMNSETPGNLIDRLSINALKIFHMDEETRRKCISDRQKQKCEEKLKILQEQRKDLGICLDQLVCDLEEGRKILKVYRQLKMYNDHNLNPVLYTKSNEL